MYGAASADPEICEFLFSSLSAVSRGRIRRLSYIDIGPEAKNQADQTLSTYRILYNFLTM
jgi:hypothetical protein